MAWWIAGYAPPSEEQVPCAEEYQCSGPHTSRDEADEWAKLAEASLRDDGWLRRFVLAIDFWLLTAALFLIVSLCHAGLGRHESFPGRDPPAVAAVSAALNVTTAAPTEVAAPTELLRAPTELLRPGPRKPTLLPGPLNPTLIIVAGMPYSGLSLVQSALAEQCRASPGCVAICPPQLVEFFEELQPFVLHSAKTRLSSFFHKIKRAREKLFVVECGSWNCPKLPWNWTDVLSQPDLYRLHRLAQQSGVELHAVVLEQDVAEVTRRYLHAVPKGEQSRAVAQAYGMQGMQDGLPLFFQRRLYHAAMSLHMQLELMGHDRASCLCLYCQRLHLGRGKLQQLLPGALGRLRELAAQQPMQTLDYKVPEVNAWYAAMLEPHVARFRRMCYGEGEGHMLRKRSSGAEQRFLSFVGLEGTGHHFWEEQLEGIGMGPKELQHSTSPRRDFSKSFGERGSGPALEMNPHIYKSAFEAMPGSLQQVFRTNPGVCLKASVKMQSFPTTKGVFKALHLLDIVSIASVLDGAGVDVRFLVSLRSMENILSSVEHRGFNSRGRKMPEGYQPRVTEAAAAFLLAALKLLDPAFLICTDYDDLQPADVTRVEAFSGRQLPSSFMETYRSHWHKREELSERQRSSGVTLEALLQEMDKLCKAAKG